MNAPRGWSDKSVSPVYDLAVVIGRFQPFHNGHQSLIHNATLIANNLLVLVGSSTIARNIKNPFTFDEREAMIKSVEPKAVCQPLVDDLYNDNLWVAQVQQHISNELGALGKPDGRVVLVGHHKDDSSYYLDMFPMLEYLEIKETGEVEATTIRNVMFGSRMVPADVVPIKVQFYLKEWAVLNKPTFENLCEEYQFIQDYKRKNEVGPFPPYYVTTDAVVLCQGHILLIKRRVAPGKGLWALPGGFLGQNERLEDSMLRELDEETRIRVSKDVLRASIKSTHVFDHPNRSLRGRTITHASLIVLNERTLPKVRGSDDAERAKWFSLADFYEMQDQMYEDHHSIATCLIGRAG